MFWVHADSETSFRKAYNDIGNVVGLSSDLKGDDMLRAVQHWMEQQTNVLLILDNADDLQIFKTGHYELQSKQGPHLLQFVPRAQEVSVVWVSRDRDILGNIVDVSRSVDIGAMTFEESLRLFQNLSGRDEAQLSIHKDELLQLLEKLKRLPLAIAQAAAYIRKTKVSVRQYLEFFSESESRQSNLLSQEFHDVSRSDVPNSVMLTWRISMRQLAAEGLCGDILNTIAFFDNQEIPFEMLKHSASPEYKADEIMAAAGRLMDYSFLQALKGADEDLKAYEQHSLVSLAVRQALPASEARKFSGKAMWIMQRLFPDGSHGTWSTCESYLPHALKALSWEEAESYDVHAPGLLERIAKFYGQTGRFDEAEVIGLKLLHMYVQQLGEEHRTTSLARLNLAMTWYRQGRYKDAEEAQVRLLEELEKRLGKEDTITMATMVALAVIWYGQGRFNEAAEVLIEVLNLQKTLQGEEEYDSISVMTHLAHLRSQQGKASEAEDLRSRVSRLLAKRLGQQRSENVDAMTSLARNWFDQGRLSEAEKLQITLLDTQKQTFGAEQAATVTAMADLAETWIEQGRLDEAAVLKLEVLELRKAIYGEKHFETISAMATLAKIRFSQGRFSEAEEQQLKVLQLHKAGLGERHPTTIAAQTDLAITLVELHRTAEAEKYQIEAFELQTAVVGEKHFYTILAMSNLVVIWWILGRRQEARQLQARAVSLQKEMFGEDAPATIRAVLSLTKLDHQLNQDDQGGVPLRTSTITPVTLTSGQTSTGSKNFSGRRSALKKKFLKWKESGTT